MRILIAEDDPVSRKLLQRTLEKWEHEIVVASDGREAWRIIESEQAPALWILDWMMPEIAGVDLCRRARLLQLPMSPYIIMLTALSSTEDIVTALDAGANDYIVKPFNQVELRARINVGMRVLNLQLELLQRIQELESALTEVKTLRGIIKVCSYCGRAQRDDTSWAQIEAYVQEHTDAAFSHGICPECLVKVREEMTQQGL